MKEINRKILQEERTETLRKKDFDNAKALLEWLVLARETAEENSQLIIDSEGVSKDKKNKEENDFIYETLSSLQFPVFLMERMEEAQKLGNEQEQTMINELKLVIEGKKDEIEEIKKIIEESNSSSSNEESIKRNPILRSLSLKANRKKKRQSQIINVPMNSNKKVIENVRKLLALGEEKLENNAEVEVLLNQIKLALQQNNDDDLKVECEKLCNELDNDEYKNISILSNGLSKTLWKHYLDEWHVEETNEITAEQKEKFDKLEQESEELKQKIEELEKEKEELEEKVKSGSSNGASIPLTPMTPMTPGLLPKDEERQEIDAREWLENNYGEDKEDVYEITAAKSLKLTDELVIKDYGNLETISLEDMEITKLVIENCPNIEEIEVYGNELTEIIGLEDLPKLKKVACGNNQISGLDVSKNTKLTKLLVFDNPNFSMIGLQNLVLTEFKGDRNNPINLIQITKEELEEAAKELGIEEKELENKSPEEIKGLIQAEGNIIKENENKLNDPDKGLPGLLKKKKVDDSELEKIKKEIAKVEEIKKEVERAKEETRKAQEETRKAREREKVMSENLKEEKQLAQITEIQLLKNMGKDDLKEFKEKVQKALERERKRIEKEKPEAKIEVDSNK